MNKNRKVAFYARVSTDHEAQTAALSNQIKYYGRILELHPEWEKIEIYVDDGISGTSIEKRASFLRMIEDAKKGKFDLIVTREVSRFSRNTVDVIECVRLLRLINVEVWFTEDNIMTIEDAEYADMKLELMAILAENESRKISQRVKAGQKISMRKGVPYGNGNILGYDRDAKERCYVINEEQAQTVRRIFDLYLEGNGLRTIKDILEKEGRLTAMGKTVWNCEVISRVLKNPFYIGIMVYKKQIVTDFLSQKRVNNHGKVEKIFVEGKHETFITKEEFDEVQRLFATRNVNQSKSTKKARRQAVTYSDVWVKKARCNCGRKIYRRNNGSGKERQFQYLYLCSDVAKNGSKQHRINKGLSIENTCTMPSIPRWNFETQAYCIFKYLLNDIKKSEALVLELMKEYDALVEAGNLDEKRITLENMQRDLEKAKGKYIDLLVEDLITKTEYNTKRADIADELRTARLQLRLVNLILQSPEVNVENIVRRYLNNITLDWRVKSSIVPGIVIDSITDRIIAHDDCFQWYLNVGRKDFELSLKDLLKQVDKKNPDKLIVEYDYAGEKVDKDIDLEKYIYLTTLNVTKDDVNVVIAGQSVYKKANGFKEFKVEVYI